jgi:hypothetical protein
MERTDWLDKGFDSAQARFLTVTAIPGRLGFGPVMVPPKFWQRTPEMIRARTRSSPGAPSAGAVDVCA